ncbi:MAG TPA: hypothetical protein VJ738_20340 [Steroidobacteraceae bacterium]|nr:hypothetical protein [Steroidobacteraceae bacterium]
MNRQTRIAILVNLWAVAGIGAVCPTGSAKSAVAASICSRLVRQMRLSPATVAKDETVPKMLPWIVPAQPHQAEEEPVFPFFAPKWHLPLPPTIESLPGTDLFMASTILGSMDCLNGMFIEWKRGSAVRVLSWPDIPTSACSRAGVWGGLATVLGQPAYIEYGSLNPNNMDSVVVIAPWEGKNWGRPCPVSISFTYRYDVTLLDCGATKELCDAARRVAPEVKRRYDAYLVSFNEAFTNGVPFPKFRFRGPLSAGDRAIVARARRIGIPKSVAPGTGAPPAWLRNLNPGAAEYFPLPLDGKLYLGAADSKVYPSTGWPGWVFFVFETPTASGQRLIPLAAFTVNRVTSGVRSIEAKNNSTPASDSARIPMR